MDDLNEFIEFDETDETLETVAMIDENGDTTEFVVIDGIEAENSKYLLVILSEDVYDDEPEAVILKETGADGTDIIYSFVEDDDEYNKVLSLFQDDDNDYELKF